MITFYCRSETLVKLQYMMQSQWNEAVNLLTATPQRKVSTNNSSVRQCYIYNNLSSTKNCMIIFYHMYDTLLLFFMSVLKLTIHNSDKNVKCKGG